ncbi:hypothetical protein SAMN05443144_12553 [Fodinibius roseus]|uniref:Capsule polysaccharide biosynthesis protein n=2 Tax=Fodinibius roseus TaxID=1194090 RepID=A0A1M5J2U4_9BACT|nr:hypothetical protein SAMN05443144_12553 [Fodinibius roseus]
MILSRSDLRDLINKIENDYSVTEWKHNGYYIWPVLRIQLYLMLTKKDEKDNRVNAAKKNRLKNVFELIRGASVSVVDYLKLERNYESIYCGAPSHRVNYQGLCYNRYFDYLMDKESAKTLLMERNARTKAGYYKPGRVILISDLLKCHRLDLKAGDFVGRINKYVKRFEEIIKKENLEISNYASQATRYISNVERAVSFFKKFLQKTNPEKVYELCYYSTSLLGLNIAADQFDIKTIDVQHGPQGEQHLAYGSWHSVPKEGYEAIPDEFHTWDKSSENTIRNWTDTTQKHTAKCKGNPWVEGWKRGEFSSSGYQYPENLVLYTLQPVKNPLEGYLLETIKKTSNKWNWWLRIHPRQKGELDSLKNKLHEHKLLEAVNIDDASELLLPEILLNTKVHLTKFSGCAIEAYQFGIPTIILDEIGEEVFKDYFGKENMSSYTGEKSDILIQKLITYISN